MPLYNRPAALLLVSLSGLVAASWPAFADLVCTSQAVATTGRGTALLDGGGDRIVYLSDRDLDGDTTPFRNFWLFLWDAQEGSSLLADTTALAPSISEDGRRIAVYDGQNEILLWQEGHGFRQITHTLQDALDPAISGDGRRIAFTSGFGASRARSRAMAAGWRSSPTPTSRAPTRSTTPRSSSGTRTAA